MKKIFSLLLVTLLLISVTALAESTAPVYEYVDVPVDSTIKLDGDFSIRFSIERVDGKCDRGLLFYLDDAGDSYGFKVRWNDNNRADFYGVKNVGGTWKGFLIADEYQEFLKDCFVSVDEGWDTTQDTQMELTITVQGTMATVTMKGNVTGKEGTIHFDLTKSPWLDFEEKEATPLVLSSGTTRFDLNGGNVLSFSVDSATYAANQK